MGCEGLGLRRCWGGSRCGESSWEVAISLLYWYDLSKARTHLRSTFCYWRIRLMCPGAWNSILILYYIHIFIFHFRCEEVWFPKKLEAFRIDLDVGLRQARALEVWHVLVCWPWSQTFHHVWLFLFRKVLVLWESDVWKMNRCRV